MMPLASSAQMKCSLNITQLDLDTSSLGICKNLSPSFVLVDISSEIRIYRDCQELMNKYEYKDKMFQDLVISFFKD